MDLLPLVIVTDYGVMIICMSLGTYGFGYILHRKLTHKPMEMSYCMILYIFAEFLFASTSLVHVIYLTVFWKYENVEYNTFWLYFTAIPQTLLLLIIPITVFFLGLDRCLCLLFPYRNRNLISKIVFIISLVTVTVFSCVNAVFYVLPAYPTEVSTTCRSSGCLASAETAKIFSSMRYAASISNVFIGLILLKLVRKKIIAKNALTKKNNRLAVVTLLMAILLDFLPHLVNFSLNTFKDINLTKFLGPYSLLFASINTSICAITYYKTIRRQSNSSIKQQIQTNNMYPPATSTQPSKKY